MPLRKVQVGQVWKNDENGEFFLITKTYSEALATYALLRRSGAETEPPLRIKVSNSGSAQTLPGYTFTHQSDES